MNHSFHSENSPTSIFFGKLNELCECHMKDDTLLKFPKRTKWVNTLCRQENNKAYVCLTTSIGLSFSN